MLATELFKVKNTLPPHFMKEIIVENAQEKNNLRKTTEFQRNNVKMMYNRTEA